MIVLWESAPEWVWCVAVLQFKSHGVQGGLVLDCLHLLCIRQVRILRVSSVCALPQVLVHVCVQRYEAEVRQQAQEGTRHAHRRHLPPVDGRGRRSLTKRQSS